jgi:hypothetical protein
VRRGWRRRIAVTHHSEVFDKMEVHRRPGPDCTQFFLTETLLASRSRDYDDDMGLDPRLIQGGRWNCCSQYNISARVTT